MPTGPTLTIQGLAKQFGAVRAVDDLSFTVRPGVVTKLPGTQRVRQARPRCGCCSGWRNASEWVPRRRSAGRLRRAPAAGPHSSGSSPEPGFHPGRTGLAHLETYAPQVGVGRARCREVLDLVGMGAYAGRRVGAYSMGMKQRLGLATALLADPPAVVLDQPASGLDPEGIVWMRGLLRRFAAEGRTVLVSSHVLSEVQHTVDEVVVIARGRLVHVLAGRSRRHRRGGDPGESPPTGSGSPGSPPTAAGAPRRRVTSSCCAGSPPPRPVLRASPRGSSCAARHPGRGLRERPSSA